MSTKNIITIKTDQRPTFFIKFEALIDGRVVGRIFLYLIYNQLHDQPYGLLEDLFVEEDFRHQGIGAKLVRTAISKARELKCYKLLGTSRFERPLIHRFYREKFGFKKYGYEFRLDL